MFKLFEQFPKEIPGSVKIYGEESTGHLFIARNDDARQIEIYISSKTADKITVNSYGEVKKQKLTLKLEKEREK